ncbi:MAG: hypothetical protein DBX51_02585 [Clostridiales bacterium]|nr:MAG: hypothetical protein DBX51_02585 [Clostridiales bacterium]
MPFAYDTTICPACQRDRSRLAERRAGGPDVVFFACPEGFRGRNFGTKGAKKFSINKIRLCRCKKDSILEGHRAVPRGDWPARRAGT